MADEREMLESLRRTANEAFSGLHADDELRRRIFEAVAEKREKKVLLPRRALVPALCGLLVVVAAASAIRGKQPITTDTVQRSAAAGDTKSLKMESAEVPHENDRNREKQEEAQEPGIMLCMDDSASFAANDAEPGLMPRSVVSIADNGLADLALLESYSAGAVPVIKEAAPAAFSVTISDGVIRTDTLFETEGREIPVIWLNGAVYRLLREPEILDDGMVGEKVGTIAGSTETPSLSIGGRESVSNCVDAGTDVYAVAGISSGTCAAAPVNGHMRLFQRASYAGYGCGSEALETTLDLRGQIREMTLEGKGTLTGEDAEQVFSVLLDCAQNLAEDAEMGWETLTLVLQNGLRLQMTVADDCVIACGAWSCPEFFEAFREKMN